MNVFPGPKACKKKERGGGGACEDDLYDAFLSWEVWQSPSGCTVIGISIRGLPQVTKRSCLGKPQHLLLENIVVLLVAGLRNMHHLVKQNHPGECIRELQLRGEPDCFLAVPSTH